MSENQDSKFQKYFRDEEIKRKAGWFRGKRTWWEIAGLVIGIALTWLWRHWVIFVYALVILVIVLKISCYNRNAKVTVPGYEEKRPDTVVGKQTIDFIITDTPIRDENVIAISDTVLRFDTSSGIYFLNIDGRDRAGFDSTFMDFIKKSFLKK